MWLNYLIVVIVIAIVDSSFEEIMTMKKSKFEKIVTKKLKAEAFNYLKNKIKSKWSKIDYGERLEMQNYLKPNKVISRTSGYIFLQIRNEWNKPELSRT